MITDDARPRGNGLSAVVAILTVGLAAVAGNLATLSNLRPWYASLAKPAFNPPNWVFGPVWTVLYILMAFAFWRVLRRPRGTGKTFAVTAFVIQMILNALWSIAFFGLHSPLMGLVVIALMIVAIITTIAAFARLDRLAAGLLAPYLAWVAFASVLNGFIFILNP
ncbi:MAG: TspO/MBR family protein [Asticcacaulis sp.]